MRSETTKRNLAILFSAVVMVALTWNVAGKMIVQDYELRLKQGEERAQDLALFFERDTRQILLSAEVYVVEAMRLFQGQNIEALRAFTDHAMRGQESVSHLTIANADGKPVFVSGHQVQPGTSLADRIYFQQAKHDSSGRSLISLPYEGRNTGRMTVRLVRRIENPDGSFGGVAFAAIPIDQFTEFFNAMKLGPTSSATLIGAEDKRIRARSSYGRVGPGQDISASVLWKNRERSDVGIYWQTSVVDGVERLYAFRNVADYPLVVAIGLAKQDVIVDASGFARSVQAIAGLATVVILGLTAMLCRELIVRRKLENEISDRCAAQADLAAANVDLEQYAYSASHDLKAPLSSIRGLLELSRDDLANGLLEDVGQHIDTALEIAKRSASKVQGLLRIARCGKEPGETEAFSLKDLVDEIWKDQTAGMDKTHTLTVSFDRETVVSDRSSLHAILENLISNALRYCDDEKPRATIHVAAVHGADGFTLWVEDNGVGIAEDFQARIFDSFVSVDDRGGDGLGLSLVQKHVSRLGGKINVHSEVGEGTTFQIVLPDREGQADEHSSGRGRRQSSRPLHSEAAALAG